MAALAEKLATKFGDLEHCVIFLKLRSIRYFMKHNNDKEQIKARFSEIEKNLNQIYGGEE